MITIKRYTSTTDRERWNQFVAQSKQATFLLDRSYMDYHSDRFHDHSLMIFRNDKLYALLPANENGDTFYSHQGLTYAGLITNEKASAEDVCQVFVAINEYLKQAGFRKCIYKPLDLPAAASRRRPLCPFQGMPCANLRQEHFGSHQPEASAEMV